MSGEQAIKVGSICHVEIPGPDQDKMQAFYGSLFGWQFVPMMPGYTLFSAGDDGGAIDAQMPVVDGGVVLVLAVEDIDAKLAGIAAAGGEGLTPKTEISAEHGYYAYFRDPCGNKMGIWSRN